MSEKYTVVPTSDPFMGERVPNDANGLNAARGVRNAFLLAPLVWGAMIAIALWFVGVL